MKLESDEFDLVSNKFKTMSYCVDARFHSGGQFCGTCNRYTKLPSWNFVMFLPGYNCFPDVRFLYGNNSSVVVPPAPRLVGVEPNPGPGFATVSTVLSYVAPIWRPFDFDRSYVFIRPSVPAKRGTYSEFAYVPDRPRVPMSVDWKRVKIAGWCCLFGVVVAAFRVGAHRYFWRWTKAKISNIKQSVFSSCVSRFNRVPAKRSATIRSTFREASVPHISSNNPGHSHPISAAWRSSAVTLSSSVCNSLGLKPFVYQASASDVRQEFIYHRDYHWMKDVTVPSDSSEPTSNNVVVLVDVDYYLDLAEKLLEWDQPLLLYSFQPSAVAGAVGEFSFSFDRDDHVDYRVAGGATYKHEVWNFCVDTITVSNWWCTKTYIVERKAANDHHQYVMLVPIGRWFGLWSWVVGFLDHTPLTRLKVNHGDFNILDVQGQTGLIRSVARVGEYNSASISVTTFDALGSVTRNGATKVGNATVVSWISEAAMTMLSLEDRKTASALVDYLRNNPLLKQPMTVYPANSGVRRFQYVSRPALYDPDVESLMQSFMSPILPGAFIPDNCSNNEKQSIKGRVVLPQAEADRLSAGPVSAFLMGCMNEFVERLFPIEHLGQPCEVEDVLERQSRPSQRSLLEQADAALPKREISTFMKGEAYQNVTDPRTISTFNTVDKREYARYMYPISDHVAETCSWYSFGKTPVTIAQSVSSTCQSSPLGVNATDASRMDGHVNEKPRLLERMTLLRYFHPSHHNRLIELHSVQFNMRARTKHKNTYKVKFQRGSGSGETAFFNTELGKFISYLARRIAGVGADEAYAAAGDFGGDDALDSQITCDDIGADHLVQAGAMMGQKLEVVVFRHGSTGVNYLSRFFNEDVWTGGVNSTCDIYRTLAKLHVTTPVSGLVPLEKLRQKLCGLALTDRNTPIIIDILNACERIGFDLRVVIDDRLASWWHQYEASVNWPNGFQDPDGDSVLMRFIPYADDHNIRNYLVNVKTAGQLLTMPTLCGADDIPHKVKPGNMVVVDNELVIVPPSAPEEDVVMPKILLGLPVAKLAAVVCPDYVIGKCDVKPCPLPHVQVCKDWALKTCTRKSCKFSHDYTHPSNPRYKPASLVSQAAVKP